MAASNEFYDELETRDPGQRAEQQFAALADQVAHAKQNSGYFASVLKDVDPIEVNSPAALAKLPLTRKSDLTARQQAEPPLGGLNAVPLEQVAHIFMSPGPIFEPDGEGRDHWRFGRALFAAGVRSGDIVHNTFAYHLTPAGMLVESAARALGCPVIPAGVGNTELQVQAIAHLRPAAYGGTPSFLKILLDKAAETGADVSSLTKASVGAEPLPPSLRQELIDRGVFTTQSYGTADLGLVAYESPAMEGMIIDEGVIMEIVRPGTGDPVPDGEVGEIVVTTFNKVYPLVRFATGDLSAVLPGASPCGRTNTRIKGWMGRADQSAKVRGMFVHPKQVNEIAARHEEIARARLVLENPDNKDRMTLRCEVSGGDDSLQAAITESVQSILKLRGEVELVQPGSLPNDGKVIDDTRTYE